VPFDGRGTPLALIGRAWNLGAPSIGRIFLMASWNFTHAKLGRVCETLLIATAGALLFVWIGFPAGLIIGSMLAVAIAALAGRPLLIPGPIARTGYFLIGVSLGSVVTPQTLHGIVDWPVSIALISVSTICMTLGTMSYLRWVHGWDALSALYGGSPGGQAQVIVLAAEHGADLRAVVIVQTVRVVFLTLGIPIGLALFGLAASPTATLGIPTFGASPWEVLLLVAVSTFTALALQWLRFPAGMIFGAMLGSGILHGSGVVHAALPWWVASAAIIMLGATTGARFVNTPARMLFSYLGAALGSFAVAIVIATVFVLLVETLTPARIADLVVAFSPGAQDTMMVLALSLNIDPVFVGAHQLARYLIVSLSLPFLAHVFASRDDNKSPD
jgi:membrane AbrB-like protein